MAISTFGLIITPIIELLAGLGAFLIAVKIMSDSMSRLANTGIKRLFQKMDGNKLAGVGIGALTTAVIQSSAVTTVMVIGFVNANIMSLAQATSVIMGANIGTTVTAQIAALGAFDFMRYVPVITLVGFLAMSISKKEKWQNIGYMVAGLGLVFLALEFMTDAMSPFTDVNDAQYGEIAQSVQNFLANINNPFVLLLLGVVMTFCLQSSSAMTAILISMASAGLVVGGTNSDGGVSNGVLFVILGSNIGTCFTSLMATAGTNTNAKRSAFIHLLFNVSGSLLFFVMLVIWQTFMSDTFSTWFSGAPATQIAMFHTFFNVVCTALFLPFTKLFVRFAEFVIRDKKGSSKQSVMLFLDKRFISNASVALQQASLEARRMGDLSMDGCDKAVDGFLTADTSTENDIKKISTEVAEINEKIVEYVVEISAHAKMSVHNEKVLSALYYVLGDLLRISDISLNIIKYTRQVAEGSVKFSESVYPEVRKMYNKIRVLYGEAMECFISRDESLLEKVEKHEDEIDEMRKNLVSNHIERLNKGECNPSSNGVYINLIGNLERMADHMTFIAESINKVN